jgi:2-aminoadipate transaminase
LYLWLRLPAGIDAGFDGPLFRRAAAAGVLYVPGEPCFPRGLDEKGTAPFSLGRKSGQSPKNTLRVSFGMPAADDIVRGIEALGRALREVLP